MDIPTFVRNTAVAVQNALYTRAAFITRWLDCRRDIDAECGHPDAVSLYDYDKLNQRGDVAARVVSILPEETWSQDPEVFETDDIALTEFEAAWMELNTRLSLLSKLQRVDVLSGIGRYGILLLGFDDGGQLDQEIGEGTDRELLYVRPLDETVLEIKTIETNSRSPRYGLPVFYEIKFAEDISSSTVASTKALVHHSRVVHVADNRINSEIFGLPRMKRVINRLMDVHKVASSSGEMFWKGGFPGLSLQSHPNTADDPIEFDKDATKEQMEAYMNGLQRYIATIGMDVKSLEVQVADPRPHVETQLRLIATTLGVPWRIFVGSESAHLASSQDEQTWNRRLTQRRRNYVNPYLIRPFIDTLIKVGVLPKPAKYDIWWPDLNTPSEEQRAANAEKQSNAMAKYVQSGANLILPPFYYLTAVLGFDDSEATAILKQAKSQELLLEEPEDEEPQPAFSRNGN